MHSDTLLSKPLVIRHVVNTFIRGALQFSECIDFQHWRPQQESHQ